MRRLTIRHWHMLLVFVFLATLLGPSFATAEDATAEDATTVDATTVEEKPAAEQNSAETTDDADSRYTYNPDHDRHGIGKFYMGREIARVMGHQGIDWLERPEREKEERLSLLIKVLDIQPGDVVADIGAGSGVITLMLVDKVGPKGTVLAVDIQQEMLDALSFKLKEQKIDNVELVKGERKSPRLKPNTVDLAFMVDVYHEFDFPYEMIQNMAASLKPGGRIAFVEYRKEDPTIPILEVHKMSQEQVKKEMAQPEFHLKWTETIDKLPRQHVIIFEKQAE